MGFLFLLALAACGSSDVPAPAPGPTSPVARPTPPPPPLPPTRRVSPALDEALRSGTFVAFERELSGAIAVLAEASLEDATGAPSIVRTLDPLIVVEDASPTSPEALTGLANRSVTVIANGRTCAGTIRSVHAVRLIVPHFGARLAWRGDDQDETTIDTPLPAADVASQAWGMGTRVFYAASVDTVCGGAYAVSLVATERTVAFRHRVPATSERRDLDRAFSGPRDSTFLMYEHDSRRIAAASYAGEPCSESGASPAFAMFEFAGASPTAIREAAPIGADASAIGVFDIEGDGRLEAVVQRANMSYSLVELTPEARPLRTIEADYLDCGC